MTLFQNAHASLLKKVLVACAFCVSALCIPAYAQAEYIESFTANITIAQDSTFEVTERIEYAFTSEKHGIYRCIPTKHHEPASSLLKHRYVEVSVLGVQMDGVGVPYVSDKNAGEVCIQIGDPDSTITGMHTYEISYGVAGAISYPEFGGADLYWNVVGDAWGVPIKSVIAKVSSPDPIILRERSCYLGLEGDTLSCAVREEDGVVVFSGANLNPYESFTISQALNRGKLAHDIREEYNIVLFGIAGGLLALLILSFVIYRHRTKYQTDVAIIPQYEPYPEVKPMDMGVLFDGNLDAKDIAAGLVYLAEQKYISIKNIEKKVLYFFDVDDYEVTLKAIPEGDALVFEIELLKLLFGESLVAGTMVRLSDVRGDAGRTRENAKRIEKLQTAMIDSLLAREFYTSADFLAFISKPIVWVLTAVGVVLVIFFSIPFYVLIIVLCVAFVAVSGPRRSRLGYEAQDYLKGFKDFLRVTESQRYIFHNAPEKNAEHFMEFLPYAIAFGVEKEWAKTFEGITIPQPDWYEGRDATHAFAAMSLVDGLTGFSNSVTGTLGSQSTSSGGGFSGGGAGGGGGGSW